MIRNLFKHFRVTARPVLTSLETKLRKESRQIRILSNAAKEHDIELELVLTYLDDAPDFLVLSYTWGSA